MAYESRLRNGVNHNTNHDGRPLRSASFDAGRHGKHHNGHAVGVRAKQLWRDDFRQVLSDRESNGESWLSDGSLGSARQGLASNRTKGAAEIISRFQHDLFNPYGNLAQRIPEFSMAMTPGLTRVKAPTFDAKCTTQEHYHKDFEGMAESTLPHSAREPIRLSPALHLIPDTARVDRLGGTHRSPKSGALLPHHEGSSRPLSHRSFSSFNPPSRATSQAGEQRQEFGFLRFDREGDILSSARYHQNQAPSWKPERPQSAHGRQPMERSKSSSHASKPSRVRQDARAPDASGRFAGRSVSRSATQSRKKGGNVGRSSSTGRSTCASDGTGMSVSRSQSSSSATQRSQTTSNSNVSARSQSSSALSGVRKAEGRKGQPKKNR